MPLPVRKSRRIGPPIEVLLAAAGLLVLAGTHVRRNPLMLHPAPAEEVRAAPSPGQPDSDVLVVVPTVAEASDLDELSFDQGWVNAVEQEVGPCRTIDAGQVSRSSLDPFAWVILPRRAAGQLDATQIQFVHNWIEDGGVAIVEQPEGPWASLIGQSLVDARGRETRRITSFDGAVTRGELRADIIEMPVHGSLMPYNPQSIARGRDYEVLMEIDGQPAVVSRTLGRGRLILLLFHLSRAVALLQQGAPATDFSIGDPAGIPESNALTRVAALVADPELRTARIPFADLLERNILYLGDEVRPIPRLWLFPGDRRGALLALHSEGGFGERAEFMPIWEHEAGARSTLFAIPRSLEPEALARISRLESDIQLQWVPAESPGAPDRSWGIGGFRPVHRAMSLREQTALLDFGLVPYPPVLATRSHDGLWPRNWFAAFRRLDAQGVRMDLSYGPASATHGDTEEAIGYLFGTGLPFRPIDANGNRFRIQELPVVIHDGALGYSSQQVRRLLVDAAGEYHTAIAADWRPDTMTVRPSHDALEGWRSSFELAESQELWVTTVREYVDFLDRRSTSRISSTFARDERRLSISVRLDGPRSGGDTPPAQLTPAVAFPARFDGRPAEQIHLDGQLVEISQLGVTGDRVLHILHMEPGEHHIEVIYVNPPDPTAPR